jgi:high-affinity iron transporter
MGNHLSFRFWRARLSQAALILAVALATLISAPAFAAEADADAEVRQTWKLLDYIAVDYPGAVSNGAIISEAEYGEMKEFADTALAKLSALPARNGQQELVKQAQNLQAAIAGLRDPEDVASIAHAVADALLAVYPVPVAPNKAPQLARGQAVFAAQCAVCHGAEGRGDGPAAASLDPPAIAFTDHARARERSLFSLFEVVSQGLADTSMIGFQSTLTEEERWAVAFYIGTLAATPDIRQAGETIWKDNEALRARIPNLEALARLTEASLATEIGDYEARAVMSYLRSHPDAVGQEGAGSLSLARAQLAESVKAYQAGDAKRARTLALSSYLDGFEPVEALLSTRDSNLLAQVESGMINYRSLVSKGAPVDDVVAQARVLTDLFDSTETTLSAAAQDATATFLGAFTILVREGIEALLVVVAMIGFLTKVERRDVLPYVHAGWLLALVAGVLTWGVAAYVVDIDGANRELTEGISSLFAAVVLLGVGIWMHQKSLAGRWQIYIKDKLSTALTKKSAFFLFALAFVAVYREVFETILFYIALWTRGDGTSILGGFVAGILVLVVVTVVLLRTSRRLPITQFFAASSLLIAILAVVLAGKGFAALQEAGLVPAIAVAGPRIDALGVYPSAVPLLAQLTVLVIAVAGYIWNTRAPKAEA